MSVIRVVWGEGTGPTATAAYDAALADAGIHDYNLVVVSSVIPADAPVEVVGTAPALGPVGDRLTVVQGRGTGGTGTDGAAAALAWARSSDGRGLFYEAGGTDPAAVRDRVERGLQRGCELREWAPADRDVVVRTATPSDERACVVVCGVYGEGTPIL